jgi:hypothetical protein
VAGKRTTKKLVQATEVKPYVLPDVEARPEVDDGAWDDEGLTVKQRLFVDAIIGPAGGNATKAAEMAGYAADNRRNLESTASRTLSFVKVREAIGRRLARANLSPDWVREMTAALAASNMGSFLTLDAEGQPVIDWRQAERMGAFVQIRKYKQRGIEQGGEVTVIERQIETHNPAPYLQLLARILGIVQEPGSPTVTVTVNRASDDDLIRIATRSSAGTAEAPAGAGVSDRVR